MRVADINLLLEHDLKSLHKRVDDDGHTLAACSFHYTWGTQRNNNVHSGSKFICTTSGWGNRFPLHKLVANKSLHTRAENDELTKAVSNCMLKIKAREWKRKSSACSRYPKLLCRALHLAVKHQSSEKCSGKELLMRTRRHVNPMRRILWNYPCASLWIITMQV